MANYMKYVEMALTVAVILFVFSTIVPQIGTMVGLNDKSN